jgi:catechol 2,3-dioxygenase-like lactoylglutathione lyase family enzyme
METQMAQIPGIHHVTAICSDAQKNVDFYTGLLGLRLVKLTVNFDDPSSYHLYYGDASGSPGTIMTFFAWPGAHRGRIGAPQVTTTAFAIPAGAMEYWSARLRQQGITETRASERFGEQAIAFVDPDGLQLELIATNNASADRIWTGGDVPAEHAIRGFHSVTLSEEGYEFTAKLLTETMGFSAGRSEQGRFRYIAGDAKAGAIVDLLCVPDSRHGAMGAGVVHHVAFRTADDAQQLEWRRLLVSSEFNVSPVMDRNYFHSIYFREPGGVLFEIATDSPGFDVDEPKDQLGHSLKLPAQYEPMRRELENFLPKLKLRR